METKEMLEKVSSLVQLDIDAIHAYEQAIEKVDVQSVKNQLVSFKMDHQRHVRELSDVMRRHGGQPPEYTPDFKGFLIKGFTALRSITGTEGALKAMRTNEELTTSTYDNATRMAFEKDVQEVVERNRDDEHRHLEYIKQCIDGRVWEREEAA